MFNVTTYAYCGMTLPHGEYESIEDARSRAAQRIRYLRSEDFPVVKIGPLEWEVEEPEDCMMVPDCCGTLCIEEVEDEIEEDYDE